MYKIQTEDDRLILLREFKKTITEAVQKAVFDDTVDVGYVVEALIDRTIKLIMVVEAVDKNHVRCVINKHLDTSLDQFID